jgi:hypothetical protein
MAKRKVPEAKIAGNPYNQWWSQCSNFSNQATEGLRPFYVRLWGELFECLINFSDSLHESSPHCFVCDNLYGAIYRTTSADTECRLSYFNCCFHGCHCIFLSFWFASIRGKFLKSLDRQIDLCDSASICGQEIYTISIGILGHLEHVNDIPQEIGWAIRVRSDSESILQERRIQPIRTQLSCKNQSSLLYLFPIHWSPKSSVGLSGRGISAARRFYSRATLPGALREGYCVKYVLSILKK